ncbi:MAG: SDR family NAD(P)-dependent oxidoreductase [Planctomycetes bacterium]|nr:SDR family NAD(P)-dependent oxidoreductase [Planctomycetota bacterium]
MPGTALVTGCSRGIGLVLAVELARGGWRVLAGLRDPARGARLAAAARAAGVEVTPVALDVDDDAAVARGVAAALAAGGGAIDALVNNAGRGAVGAFEETPDAELRAQMETHYYGVCRMVRALLPHFRARGAGRIVSLSSVAGRVALPGRAGYVAAKFALEGLSETLRLELAPLGIHVSLVEPGPIDLSRFDAPGAGPPAAGASAEPVALVALATSAPPAEPAPSPYGPLYAALARLRSGSAHAGATPPEAVARAVLAALESRRPALRYVVGADARLALLARRLLPESVFLALIRRRFGL